MTKLSGIWRGLGKGFRPQAAVLACSDAVALQASAVLAFAVRSFFNPLDVSLYSGILPLLLLGPLFSVGLGASQSISLPPHKEVKQLFLAVSLTYLVVLAFLFLTRGGEIFSRSVVLSAWACSVFALPLLRGRLRRRLCRRPWWGRPLVFLQRGPEVDALRRSLADHPERGLRPVTALDVCSGGLPAGERMKQAAGEYPGAAVAILLDAGIGDESAFIREASLHFDAVLLVPRITMGEHRFWLTPRDLEEAVGLLVRQNLLDERRLRVKRCIDVLLTLLLSVAALPLGLLLALCIRLDSPGPAIYAQTRLGQNGRPFKVYKFRTMVRDADALLRRELVSQPQLRYEWEEVQKLRDDPRITRMGALLRKTSLDELPQLWNVLLGSMSLVGPRPIVENEIARYGGVYRKYMLVKPGITGLWQVSGRNNTSYAERVRLDHYYVNNWSVWMDLWVLARTFPVVLWGNGAY